MADHTQKIRKDNLTTLKHRKHEQMDFFIADEIDLFSFRDEIISMELPFFALRGGDSRDRIYKNDKTTILIKSTNEGIATIFDKDIWIYALSKLQQAINNGENVDREIYFTPYDFFVTTNRDKGGRSYKELEKTLDRLRGTIIKVSFDNDDTDNIDTFGLIQDYSFIKDKKGRIDVGMVKLVLPEWLFKKLEKKEILTINPDYFLIRKAIDRRIYELARKHCGYQYESEIGLDKLYLKTGTTTTKAKFRFNIKNLAIENKLPDYEIVFDSDRDVVIFKKRNPDIEKAEKMENMKRGKKALRVIKNQI